MKLHEQLVQSIQKLGFEAPTPIQAQAIPHALEGKDILGSAQTGTGKTFAFGIPLINKLLQSKKEAALIMAPTRELAQQVIKSLTTLLKGTSLKTATLIGGESFIKQLHQLRANPQIVVGTPGRIADHLNRGTYQLSHTSSLILDETDRMLDMGFEKELKMVMEALPEQRHTMMFSATFPKGVERMAHNFMNNPVRIAVGSTAKPSKDVDQQTIELKENEKYTGLRDQLETREGSVIVFVRTKRGAEALTKQLKGDGHLSTAMHGDLSQAKRERSLAAFRNGKARVLVATDVAARGIDVPHIQHVVNYDLPQTPEDYIHRIGRTARAGAKGAALSLITPQDNKVWKAIQRYLATDGESGFEAPKHTRKPQRSRRPFNQNANRKARFSKPKGHRGKGKVASR